MKERVVKKIAELSCKCLVSISAWNPVSFKFNEQVLRYFSAQLLIANCILRLVSLHVVYDCLRLQIPCYFILFYSICSCPHIYAAFEFVDWTRIGSHHFSLIL